MPLAVASLAAMAAGYLAVLFLLGASSVYAILKLVQFNATIVRNYQEEIRMLDAGRRNADTFDIWYHVIGIARKLR